MPGLGIKKGRRYENEKREDAVSMALFMLLGMYPSSATAAETIRIGALFPFTGSLALLGRKHSMGL